MADLRAEQIMSAIQALLTGLTTTGANVERMPAYDIAALPALTVGQGADTPLGELGSNNQQFVDTDLDITITAYAKASGTIETTLNQIRNEIHVAMMADHTLGLAFVHTTIPRGAGAPVVEQGDQPIGTMEINFTIRYRHSWTDASA